MPRQQCESRARKDSQTLSVALFVLSRAQYIGYFTFPDGGGIIED